MVRCGLDRRCVHEINCMHQCHCDASRMQKWPTQMCNRLGLHPPELVHVVQQWRPPRNCYQNSRRPLLFVMWQRLLGLGSLVITSQASRVALRWPPRSKLRTRTSLLLLGAGVDEMNTTREKINIRRGLPLRRSEQQRDIKGPDKLGTPQLKTHYSHQRLQD